MTLHTMRHIDFSISKTFVSLSFSDLLGVSGESRCCEVVLLWLHFRSLLPSAPSAAPQPLPGLPQRESGARKCLPPA